MKRTWFWSMNLAMALVAMGLFCGKDNGSGPDDSGALNDSLSVRAILDSNGRSDVALSAVIIKDTLINNARRITTLKLSGKQLTRLPAIIGNLTMLKYFYCDTNQLTSIPATIGQCTGLLQLKLNNNQLTALPATIGNLIALTRLQFENNNIDTLPSELKNCAGLNIMNSQNAWLTLDNNKLLCKSLPQDLQQWITDSTSYAGDNSWKTGQKSCTP